VDDQLLQELYGVGGEEYYSQDDALIKEAQAELIEAVADEAGVDLNEMDDDELEKFASYVLSPEEAYADEAYADETHADEAYAEADQMGRVMAHAYADEQMKIASAMELDHAYAASLEKVAHTWDMMKIAAEDKKFSDRSLRDIGGSIASRASKMTGYRDIKRGLEMTRSAKDYMRSLTPEQLKKLDFSAQSDPFKTLSPAQQREIMVGRIQGKELKGGARTQAYIDRKVGRRLLMRGGGKAAATLGVLGAAGYGVKKLRDR
jgi:hypothetical protein